MAGDFLRLHCVRGSVANVCRTVTSLVVRNGWRLVDATSRPGPADFQREVSVREENGWIVVDAGEAHFEPWAARIADALDTIGITMTSYSDEGTFELARYDSKHRTKRISHGGEAKRRREHVDLGFLEDLVPPAERAALRRGVRVKPRGCDAAALAIARVAGLPMPRATHERPGGDSVLRFAHAPPPKLDRSPVQEADKRPRSRRVSFEDTLHVRGATREAIETAMTDTLAMHDFVPVDETADAMTWAAGIVRVFLREREGLTSLGEYAIDDGRPVPSFKWAEILSRKLARPILAVWHDGKRAEAALWRRGREEARADIASLSGSAAAKALGKGALASFVRATPSLALSGEIEGIELRFRRAGAVDHRLYDEEQEALDWANRAPNLARLNPLFSDFADVTPEQALRDVHKPARRE